MLLSHEDEDGDNKTDSHPYWYAHMIGIYHVEVCHIGINAQSSGIQELDFLWVRWFGRDLDSEEESDEDEENLGLEDGEEGRDEYDALGYAML